MSNLKISPQVVNPLALQVCQVLQQAGFQSFIVGGCVRDLLLNGIPKDWDITTNATPPQVISLFPKNYPTGLQHGTVTVVMGEGVQNHFEVTTFRVEGEYLDGRRPEEVFFVNDIEQDLARRDLTINSIAYDPVNDKLIDPYGGEIDLNNHLIKAVGNATDRFNEDGLRIMRAARFSARFDYEIEESTLEAMRSCLDTLKKVSKERIKDELCKTLMTKFPEKGLYILDNIGALSFICPYLLENSSSYDSLYEQGLCDGDLETRLAFLYSNCTDIKAIEKEMIYLKFSNKEIKDICFLVSLQDSYLEKEARNTSEAYRYFIAQIKNQYGLDWEHPLNQFINLMEGVGIPIRRYLKKHKDEVVFSRKEMNIDGNNLMEMGVTPGPSMKFILDRCYIEILNNPDNNNKEFLTSFVKKII